MEGKPEERAAVVAGGGWAKVPKLGHNDPCPSAPVASTSAAAALI